MREGREWMREGREWLRNLQVGRWRDETRLKSMTEVCSVDENV